MKRYLQIIVSIFFSIALYPNEEINVADIYKQIFNNLSYIDWKLIEDDYKQINGHGWDTNKKYSVIKTILDNEKNNIEQFIKTSEILYCNFFDSNKITIKLQKVPWEKIRDITRLACLSGRYAEYKKDFNKSYLIYKSLLKLSYEIEKSECNIENFATAIAVKSAIYNPLYSLSKNHNLSKNELNELSNNLEKYASFTINLIDVMEFDKNWFISFSKSYLYDKEWEKNHNHMTIAEINDYRENYLKILVLKLDDLYKNLENAVTNNSEQKLKELYDEFIAQAKADKYLCETSEKIVPNFQSLYVKWMDGVKKYNTLKEEIKKQLI